MYESIYYFRIINVRLSRELDDEIRTKSYFFRKYLWNKYII